MTCEEEVDKILRALPAAHVLRHCTNVTCWCMGCVNSTLHSTDVTKNEWSTWVGQNRERLEQAVEGAKGGYYVK